jgi:hypothetical protein
MTRRLMGALALAMLLAGTAVVVLQDVVVADVCNQLDPDGWLYWLYRCGKESAGGGGSGAS